MKYLLLIIISAIWTCNVCMAESRVSCLRDRKLNYNVAQDEVHSRAVDKRACLKRLAIRFRWGVCVVPVRSRVCVPNYIRGYACGIYVQCFRVRGLNYRCRA